MLILRKTLFAPALLTLFLLTAGLVYYLGFTTNGASLIVKKALSYYAGSHNVSIDKVDGVIAKKVVFRDIELNELRGLPPDSLIRIQRLELSLTSLNPESLHVKIDNGRLRLPQSEPVLFYGTYNDSSLDLTAYSPRVSVRGIFDLFIDSKELKKISGSLRDIDLQITGTFLEPEITGSLMVEKVSREDFTLAKSPVSLAISLKNVVTDLKIYGDAILQSGAITGARTALITLLKSTISFSGDPQEPTFDLKGVSKVEDILISIGLKGTLKAPKLTLSSEPSRSQEKLLLALATGRTWKKTDTSLQQNQISSDLSYDFVDYVVFGNSASRLASKLGIRDISLKYDASKENAGLKSIGGELKITDSISLGAEKGLKQESLSKQTQDKPKTNDKVTIKYQKDF